MKRIITLLLVATLLIGMMPVMEASAENYATVYSGNKYGVRLREGPGTGYSQITYVPSGTTVVLLESGSIWSRLQVGTTVGYMMSKYLVSGGSSSGVVITNTATVTSGNGLRVWLRTSPKGKRIGLYSVGTSVGIVTYGDQWCKVMIGSSIGYMMTQFLQFPGTPTPTPAPTVKPLTKMYINYQYPLVGDVLKPVLDSENATYSCYWEVIPDGSTTASYTSSSATLTVMSGYLNAKIRLRVSGTGNYSGITLTDTTAQVAKDRTVTGVLINNAKNVTPIVGDVLNAIVSPSSATVTYSWRVGGSQVSTASSYTVTSGDAGKQIQVYVAGIGDFEGKANSLLTEKVASATAIQSVKLSPSSPVIGGAVSAVITPSGAQATYEWTSDGVKVGTAASYTCTTSDLGKKLQVTVKGTGDYTGTATSALSAYVSQTLLTGVTINNANPTVGNTLTASAAPSAQSATYAWYSASDKSKVIGTDRTFTVTAAYKGQKLYVVATGAGVYGGKVTSQQTAAVSEYTTLTEVTISQSKPVVGDTITAKLVPSTAATSNGNVYIWYAGTGIAAVTTVPTYKVTDADKNLALYVQVNGGGTNIGSVRSGYTSKVTGNMALSGVGIKYISSYSPLAYADLGTPMLNQELRAAVNPGQAAGQVLYRWFVGGTLVKDWSTDANLKLTDAGYRGLAVKVEVKGDSTGRYTGTVSATTAAIQNPANLLDVALAAKITPVAGKMPVTTLTGANISGTTTPQWTATVSWAEKLDIDGTFLADQVYTARVTFSMNSAYGLKSVAATDTDGAATTPVMYGTVVSIPFKAITTGKMTNIMNVTGVTLPAIGAKPDTAIDKTPQFTGAIEWFEDEACTVSAGAAFKANTTYYAKITLTAVAPYWLPTSVDGVPALTVAGARTAKYYPSGTYIVASFTSISSDTKATLTANRVTVPVGSSDKIVQLTANLSNYAGDQTAIPWTWTVNGQSMYKLTTIDANGTLTISESEPAPNTLTVTASTVIDKKTYKASLNISLVAESTEAVVPENVAIQFLLSPNTTTITSGTEKTLKYSAMVLNANDERIVWSVAKNTDTNTFVKDGLLTIGSSETAATLAITATAKANSAKSATVYLTINYAAPQKIGVNFTEKWATMTAGSTKKFTAVFSSGYTGTGTIKYIVSNNATVDASGNVTVSSAAKPDDLVAVTAVDSTNPELQDTCTVKVIAPDTSAAQALALAKEALTAAQTAKTAADQAVTDQGSAVTTANTALTAAQAERDTAATAVAAEESKLATANKDLEIAEATKLIAETEKSAADSKLENANAEKNAALNAQTEAQSALTSAESAAYKAGKALDSAQAEKAAVDADTSATPEQKTAAAEKVAAAQTAKTTADGNVTTAQGGVTAANTRVADADAAIGTATGEVNAAAAKVETATTQVNTASAAVQTANEAVSSANSALAEKQAVVDAKQLAVDNANVELKLRQDAAAAAQTKVEEAQAAVAAAEKQL